MKAYLIFLMALFPYLHGQRYTVTYHSCEPNRILVEESGTPFEITLFNLKITEDKGWEKTCSILEKAEKLEIEVDPSTQISEPLPVYLFADGELIQTTLVRSDMAYTPIHNPEYLYEKDLLLIEESKSTMAILDSTTQKEATRSQGWLFLLFLFVSWLVMILILLRKLHRFPFQKHFTKS